MQSIVMMLCPSVVHLLLLSIRNYLNSFGLVIPFQSYIKLVPYCRTAVYLTVLFFTFYC